MTQRCVLALVLALGGLLHAAPQDERAREVQALMARGQDRLLAAASLLEAKKVEESAEAAEAACEAYAKVLEKLDGLEGVAPSAILETRQVALYNTACGRSLQGKKDLALKALGAALAAGYDDFERVERDKDLDGIRKEPRFLQLIERVRQKLAKQAREAGRTSLSKEALFPYDFEVTTLDGKKLKLADLRGKIVIVDYWGTWCPPCKREIPHFVKLKEDFGEALEVVGMTWEQGKSGPDVVAKVERFAKRLKVDYPLTLLTKQEELAKVPDFEAFPTTLFIDKRGRVRAKEVGYRDYETIHDMVHALDDEGDPDDHDDHDEEETPRKGPF